MIRQAVNAGILTQNEADGTLRFFHQLFQEYFAALEIGADNVNKFVEPYELADEDWHLQVVAHKWDESIVALAGIAPDPSSFIAVVARKNPLLAVRCMNGIAGLNTDFLSQLAGNICARFASDFERQDSICNEWWQRTREGGSGRWEDMADRRKAIWAVCASTLLR